VSGRHRRLRTQRRTQRREPRGRAVLRVADVELSQLRQSRHGGGQRLETALAQGVAAVCVCVCVRVSVCGRMTGERMMDGWVDDG
jgi:hypothetical protein